MILQGDVGGETDFNSVAYYEMINAVLDAVDLLTDRYCGRNENQRMPARQAG
jgi:hypothetical protein